MLTLSLSSVPAPTITTIPDATYTYEVGGTIAITLSCSTTITSSGVTYQWKLDSTEM